MHELFNRTELLLGEETLKYMGNRKVLIVGLGGVGAYAAEMICRAGIGNILIIDGDTIDKSNINRQLLALNDNIGKYKTDILEQRLKKINPEVSIRSITEFIRNERITEILNEGFDYVVDAIDILTHKVTLIENCMNLKLPIISAMGAGGKMDPTLIQITDIEKSFNCRLAKMVRKRLHRKNIFGGFKVVFSPENVNGSIIKPDENADSFLTAKSTVGTISYMPAIFGCLCSSVVIQTFVNQFNQRHKS
jgi:tRNA A37 threonylcarbamoyladenosine dehydratase